MMAAFQMDHYNIAKISIVAEISQQENLALLYAAKYKVNRSEDRWTGSIVLGFKFANAERDREYSEIVICGNFHAAADMEQGQFEKMLKVNGAATLIPIMRAAFVSTYALMGLSNIRSIPNVNVLKLKWAQI